MNNNDEFAEVTGCRRSILSLPCWLFVLIMVAFSSAGAQECTRPALRGSFLQPALGDHWTLKQWQSEFHAMGEAGLDQMVIQWTADSKSKTTVYPSGLSGYKQNTKHDVVKRALDAADEAGAQIYLGLQVNDDWWTNFIYDKNWLIQEATVANALADDLQRRYGQHRSFAGWYLAFEVDNADSSAKDWDNLAAFYQTVGKHLHKLTPGKPIVISPFFSTDIGMPSSEWQAMWEYVLARGPIDVIALQDGVGVNHATREQLPEWFDTVQKAIQNASPSTQFWVDTETFRSGGRTMAMHAMVNNMCAVQKYVSAYLSFSYNHFISPQQVNPLYHKTYLDYLANGKVESVPPTKPAKLKGVALNSSSIQLAWTRSQDNTGVVGYKIFRNGRILKSVYEATPKYVDSGLAPNTTYSYQVRAFDAAGSESRASDQVVVKTPAPRLYPINLSVGRPYAFSMAADASYPDANGMEVTDGALGTQSYADPAWQGRATTRNYSFTIDLGSEQIIHEIRSEWLQDTGSGVLLPKQMDCAISSDNVTFTPIGKVQAPPVGDENQTVWFTMTDLSGVMGRFVQIRVVPGSLAQWTFLDEIEVRQ